MMLEQDRKNDYGRNYQKGQPLYEFVNANLLAVHDSEKCSLDEHA